MGLSRPLKLASSSPRRQFLLREAGFQFTTVKPDADESFPPDMPVNEVPRYLAIKKANAFKTRLQDEIVITADTVVIIDHEILNKPGDRAHAIEMLTRLSGRTHLVITAVSLMSRDKALVLDEHTRVTFLPLRPDAIASYVDNYQPFDKAGSYGAQECLPEGFNPCSREEMDYLRSIHDEALISRSITRLPGQGGMEAIARIEGSYFNVMGFPIHKVGPLLSAWN